VKTSIWPPISPCCCEWAPWLLSFNLRKP